VTYTARTGFWNVSSFDGSSSTDPGLANVKHGVSYTIAGTQYTGTYRGYDLWTAVPASDIYLGHTYLQDGANVTGLIDEPAASNVKTGIVYYEGQKTGTYDGSDRWTDPGTGNVAAGTQYLANGVTQTGTRQVVTNVMNNVNLQAAGGQGGTVTAG
jgi:hypothetical protein